MPTLVNYFVFPFKKVFRLLNAHRWASFCCVSITTLGAYFLILPRYSVWQFRLAEDAVATENIPLAKLHIDRALRFQDRTEFHRLAARIERVLGNFDSCERHLNDCVRLERLQGLSEETQLEWLLFRAEHGEIDEVAPILQSIALQKPTEFEYIYQTVTKVYVREIRFPRALEWLKYWLAENPNSTKALNWRGWVFERMGLKEGAVRDYQSLLEIDPTPLDVRQRLVNLLLDGVRTDSAEVHIQFLLSRDPNNISYRTSQAQLMLLQGVEPEKIRDILDSILREKPESANAMFLLGKLEYQEMNYAQAEQYLRKAVRLDPNDLEYLYNLIGVLQKEGSPAKEAEARALEFEREEKKQAFDRLAILLRSTQDISPGGLNNILELANLLLRFHHDDLGVYWLQRALKIDPQCRAAHAALAAYYEKQGRADKAASHKMRAAGK